MSLNAVKNIFSLIFLYTPQSLFFSQYLRKFQKQNTMTFCAKLLQPVSRQMLSFANYLVSYSPIHTKINVNTCSRIYTCTYFLKTKILVLPMKGLKLTFNVKLRTNSEYLSIIATKTQSGPEFAKYTKVHESFQEYAKSGQNRIMLQIQAIFQVWRDQKGKVKSASLCQF